MLRDNVYRELAFVSKDIEGGPIDEHVLALSSLASPKVSLLRIMSAQIYTDSITPLHSGDRIWVPSGMEQVRYDGRWETDQDGFQQTSEEGASVTVAFVGENSHVLGYNLQISDHRSLDHRESVFLVHLAGWILWR